MEILKIVTVSEWARARRDGRFAGSPVDLADGFIHFSTWAQVAETAARHFAGQDDLLLVVVDAERLGPALVFEPSRGGDLFPHLYGELPLSAVEWEAPIGRDADGRHIIPRRPA
ncbi:MAG: DUF952 domain-containing protein [Azospirillaceae bacterium]